MTLVYAFIATTLCNLVWAISHNRRLNRIEASQRQAERRSLAFLHTVKATLSRAPLAKYETKH